MLAVITIFTLYFPGLFDTQDAIITLYSIVWSYIACRYVHSTTKIHLLYVSRQNNWSLIKAGDHRLNSILLYTFITFQWCVLWAWHADECSILLSYTCIYCDIGKNEIVIIKGNNQLLPKGILIKTSRSITYWQASYKENNTKLWASLTIPVLRHNIYFSLLRTKPIVNWAKGTCSKSYTILRISLISCSVHQVLIYLRTH